MPLFVRPAPTDTEKEARGRAALLSPLSVRAVRTFGGCQQAELRGEPERATCQSERAATNRG